MADHHSHQSSVDTDLNWENSDNSSDSEENDVSYQKNSNTGLKREVFRDNWVREKKKKKRNSGKAYEGKDGKMKPAKKFCSVNSCCKNDCFKSVIAKYQEDIFSSFWSICNKPLQDTYICNLLDRKCVAKHKVLIKKKQRGNVWQFNLVSEGKRYSVCRKFFTEVLQITVKRVRVIQDKIVKGEVSMEEKRGKHENRPHKLESRILELIKEHLTTIPHKKSHYCRQKTQLMYFENPNLNVKIIFKAYQQYYFDKCGSILKMKYSTYHRFFRRYCGYSFRRPRTDVCDYCTACENKLKVNANDECNLHYLVHQKKVESYKHIKTNILTNATTDSDTLVVEFDYAQNLPLPKLNVTAQFYKRLLWLFVFNINCHNDGSSSFYCFMENESKKNPNTVCSFLNHFLTHKMKQFPHMKQIYFFSDSCGGQNKNNTVISFSAWFAKDRNVEVSHIFPVRGHSYNQCDRNFGVYGNNIKRVETITSVDAYLRILRQSRDKPSPFEVLMAANLVRDWSTALSPLFTKHPTTKKFKFTTQKYARLKYKPCGTVLASTAYTTFTLQPFAFFKRGVRHRNEIELSLQKTPEIQLNPEKVKDVKSLLKFLNQEDASLLLSTLDEEKDQNDIDSSDSETESMLDWNN